MDLAPAPAERLFDSFCPPWVARTPGMEGIGASAPEPLSCFDWVAAVLACFDVVPLARTSVLHREARGLLGRVPPIVRLKSGTRTRDSNAHFSGTFHPRSTNFSVTTGRLSGSYSTT